MAGIDLSDLFDLRGVCSRCGGGFALKRAAGRPEIYCSQDCRSAATRQKQKQARRRPSLGGPSNDVANCVTCGAEFSYFRKRKRRRFCSKKCKAKYVRRHLSDRIKRSLKRLRAKAYRDWRRVFEHRCVQCGAEFKSRQNDAKCCSQKCTREYQRQLGLEQTKSVTIWRDCLGCGRKFRPYRSGRASLRAKQLYCGKDCKDGKSAVPAKGPKYRARSSVDPIAVFERDEWICHLCGGLAPKRLRGTTDDLAPERDHVISIADGGADTYENSACSHRKCNRLKGARSGRQLPGIEVGYFPQLERITPSELTE